MSRAAPFVLLLLLAAGLAGSIAWQLQAASAPAAAVPRPAAAEARPGAPPPADPGARASELAEVGLRRPLFSPNRRPPPPAAVAVAAGPRAEPVVLPRLTGIILSSGSRSAIFAGDPAPVVAQEGGRVGAFTVRSIGPGQVVLAGPDGNHVLRPSFSSAPAASRPAAPPPPLPGGTLPVGLLPGSALPAPPPALPEAPAGSLPFAQNPAPSGLDILRQVSRPAGGQPPR